MFTQQQARAFIDKLLGDIWQNCRLECVDDYYTPDVIGHHGEDTFGLDDMKKRMRELKTYAKRRHFVIEDSTVIDDLIIFRMRQTWLNQAEALCETFIVGTYRIRDQKICEAWLMFDEAVETYVMINERIAANMDKFNMDERQRRRFFLRLDDYSYLRTGKTVELTAREQDCLYYYMSGLTAKEIAKQLSISYRTVEKYIGTILQKYGCTTKIELRKRLFPESY